MKMDKYIVVWQQVLDNSIYGGSWFFVLEGDRHAPYADLHKLATAKIKKICEKLGKKDHLEWYINHIINITTLAKEN
jgi:hypothetical protein